MTLETKVSKDTISNEEIQQFQKNLTAHIQSIMHTNNEEIGGSIHDYHLKSLDERINEHLINLEKNGETLHVSTKGQEYFLKAMGEHKDTTDDAEQ